MFDSGPRSIRLKHQISKADGLDPDCVVSPSMLDRSLVATLLPPVPQPTRVSVVFARLSGYRALESYQ
jgi:hypothetical protein